MMSELPNMPTNLGPLTEIINSLIAIPDSDLNEATVDVIKGMISGAITAKIHEDAVANLMSSFDKANYSKDYVVELVDVMKGELVNNIKDMNLTKEKLALVDQVLDLIFDIFDDATDRYHNYSFTLPIKLEEGATAPTYAHATDAAADLYALEDMVLLPHSMGNMVRTGVRIALPESWAAYIVPRSSIGSKTPLRLSNSVGVIDSDYRGELCVLYDNISDSVYHIKAGDRIAQLLIMPAHHFKAVEVDTLPETERGDGGFGSTGK